MDRFGCALSHLERHAGTFSVETLATVLPSALVAESIQEHAASSRRRRDLPAEFVVWLVIAAGLWRSRGLQNVLAGLGRGLCRGLRWMGGKPPTSGAVTRARRRLGEGPVHSLLRHLTDGWMAESRSRWRGMALLALDGTTMRMPDSPANRSFFGAHRTYGKATAFPLTRVVVAICAVTHVVLRAAIGTSRTSERALVPALLPGLPAGSLFLLDRGFFGYALLMDLSRAGHQFVVRLRKGTTLHRLRSLRRGDYLADAILPRALRRQRPDLPERWTLRVVTYRVRGFRPVRLLTSLSDPDAFPAQEIVARYRDRWEVEIALDEIKTHLLGEHIPLRSKSPVLIRQEIHALLIAYDAVRMLMARAAEVVAIDPRRLSFTDALDRLRHVTVTMAAAPTRSLPWLFDAFLENLATCLLPARRPKRRYPRTVKAIPSYYRVKKRRRAA